MQTHYFWVIVICWLVIFPLLTCPRLGGLKQISFVASILPVLFCFVMVAAMVHFPIANFSEITWFRYDVNGMVLGFTMIYYPTQVQLNCQHVFAEMKHPTISRSMKASFFALLFYYIPTIIVGTIGYLLFAPHKEELLAN